MKKLYTIILLSLLCGWVQAQIDSVQQIPATVPYSCDFNNPGENARWIRTRSGSVYSSDLNHFSIGTGTSVAGGTDQSLYISNDTLESYGANNETSHYFAERLLDFGNVPQDWVLELDWKASGGHNATSIYGGLKVFLRDTADLTPQGAPSYSAEYLELALDDTIWRNIRIPLANISGLKTLQLYTWGYVNASVREVPAAIDNIAVTPATCDAPLFTVTIDNTNAIFNWQGAPTDSFLIIYRPVSANAQNNVYKNVTGSTDTIGGLLSNTEYIAWMAKLCGSDTSAMYLGTHFTMGCGTYVAPFEEHFGSSQHCWTLDLSFSYGLGNSNIYTSNYVSPTSGINYGYIDTARAISPVIDVSELDYPYLKFSRIQSEYNGVRKDLNLYYRDYEEDEWHYLGTYITPTGANEWKTDSLAIPSHSTTLQLGFFSIQHENQQLASIRLDDIYVYDGPGCSPSSDLALSGFSNDTAFIHWIADPNMSYVARYREIPDTNWTYINNDLGGMTFIKPIASLTGYEVQLSPNCDLVEWVSCTFTTPVVAVNLPYFTDFSDTADRGWQVDNGSCLNHWTIGSPLVQGGEISFGNALFVTHDGTSAGYGDDHYYTTIVASKKFNMSDISTVNIEFDVLCGGNTQNNTPKDFLKVFFAPASQEYPSSENDLAYASASATTYAVNFHDFLSQTGSSFYDYKLNLTQDNVLHISVEMPNPTPNGEAQLAFLWRNDYSTNGDVQPGPIITNVHVWQPDCDVVSYLQVGDIVGGHATVSWVPPTESESFVVEYKPQYADWNAAMTSTCDTNFLILNNLTPNEAYNVRVRANCGSVLGFGNWRYTSFNTACSIVVTDSIPYVMDFSGSVDCWNLAVNPNHAWSHSSYSANLSHTFHESSSMGDTCPVYSPLMDISAVTTPYLKLTHTQYNQILGVAYRTSSMNPWQHLVTYSNSSATDSVLLPVSGPYIQLAFYATNNSWGYVDIDYVSVYNGPSCAPLTNLTTVDVSSNAAAISWVGSNENGFVVRYRNISDTVWTYVTTTDTFFIINNLQGSTTYLVQVSGNCDEPNWLSTQISTLLTPTNLPYFTDFSPNSDRGWLLNNGSCTNYWTMGEVDAANQTNALFVTKNGSVPGYDTTARTLVTAEKLFEVGDADTIMVEFDLRVGGENYCDFLKLFLAPEATEYPASATADQNNPNYGKNSYSTNAYNFNSYAQYTNNNGLSYYISETSGNGFVHITALMKNPIATNPNLTRAKVVFLWKSDHMWGMQPGAIITNVFVSDTFVVCHPVTQLTVSNIHNNSADISWFPIGGETDWVLEYKEASSSVWTVVNVNGTPALTLTGLTPYRSYNVRVKADCGGTSQSPYTNTSFETPLCDYTCPYMFVLSDNWGDGWNGGVLSVMVDGVQVADLAAENHHLSQVATYDTVWVDLCHNASVELSWDGGGFPEECGVTLIDPDGTQLYQQIGYPLVMGDSTVFTFTADCQYALPVVVTDSADNITQNQAVLHGHIASAGDLPILERGFEWKPLSETDFTAVITAGDSMSFLLGSLTPNTDFVYHAFATTLFGTEYGDNILFSTLAEEVLCPTPSDLHATDSSSQSLAIAWTENGDAVQWNILYRINSGAIDSAVSDMPSYLITNLQPNTTYQIQVQSVCDTTTSEWTPVMTASTTTGLHDYGQSFLVYPNPANTVVYVCVNNDQFSGEIQVCDVYGKVVRTVVGANDYSPLRTRIDISDLAAGMYFVRVATEAGMVTKAFVKQ